MAQNICWLPGWASDFSQWKTQIQDRWIDSSHHFISYPEMLEHRDTLSSLPQVRTADCIVAWSLGSLLAFRASKDLPAHIPLVAVGPVAWFCHPELGWPLRVVQRMAQKLSQNPEAVLESFADRMGAADPTQKRAWVENACTYSQNDLALGLNLLATEVVPGLGSLAQKRPIQLISGELDEIVSPESTLWLSRELNPQSFQVVPNMTHWPFSGNWNLPQ